jgi:hypothetical protein
MSALPLKPEYQPSLGRLLSPRWRATSRPVRALIVAVAIGVIVLAIGGILTLLPAALSYRGPVSFHFHYRGLYRVAPDPGGYGKVARSRGGRVVDSFAVEPLHLPPYQGDLGAELPLYAAGYIRQLSARYPQFDLQGEGKTRVNTVPAYIIQYSARVGGQLMDGHDLFVLPGPRTHDGVTIVMQSVRSASSTSTAPLMISVADILHQPLSTFYFGA